MSMTNRINNADLDSIRPADVMDFTRIVAEAHGFDVRETAAFKVASYVRGIITRDELNAALNVTDEFDVMNAYRNLVIRTAEYLAS